MQNAKCRIQRTDTCEAVRTGDSPQRDLPVVRAERLLLFSIVHCPLSIMCAYVTAVRSGVSGLVRVVPGISRLVTTIAHLLALLQAARAGGCGPDGMWDTHTTTGGARVFQIREIATHLFWGGSGIRTGCGRPSGCRFGNICCVCGGYTPASVRACVSNAVSPRTAAHCWR